VTTATTTTWTTKSYDLAVEIKLQRSDEARKLYQVSADVILHGEDGDQEIIGSLTKALYIPSTIIPGYPCVQLRMADAGDVLDEESARAGWLYDTLRKEGAIDPLTDGWLHLGQIELLPEYRGFRISHFVMKEIVSALGSGTVVTVQPFPLGHDGDTAESEAKIDALENHWIRFGVENKRRSPGGFRMLWWDMAHINECLLTATEICPK
tara:strand:+ start:2510 stop:3136 length:627 start_codon:yes stop_codon:yes gene_type:complete